jgi:putative Mg2+ transporter-C (MgtC) family protein
MTFDTFYQTITSHDITVSSAIFKLLLSLIAGGLVGLNRERHKQPAGFRTHILICVGATLLMMLSIYIPQVYFDFKNGDPGRIAAQVVSGIGFLGAGAIIRMGTNIRGLTTAASIWLMSAIGLAIGAGLYIVSFVTVLIALFTLILLERWEKRFFPQVVLKNLVITFERHYIHSEDIKKILKKRKIHYQISDINADTGNDISSNMSFLVRIPETTDIGELMKTLYQVKYVTNIKIT